MSASTILSPSLYPQSAAASSSSAAAAAVPSSLFPTHSASASVSDRPATPNEIKWIEAADGSKRQSPSPLPILPTGGRAITPQPSQQRHSPSAGLEVSASGSTSVTPAASPAPVSRLRKPLATHASMPASVHSLLGPSSSFAAASSSSSSSAAGSTTLSLTDAFDPEDEPDTLEINYSRTQIVNASRALLWKNLIKKIRHPELFTAAKRITILAEGPDYVFREICVGPPGTAEADMVRVREKVTWLEENESVRYTLYEDEEKEGYIENEISLNASANVCLTVRCCWRFLDPRTTPETMALWRARLKFGLDEGCSKTCRVVEEEARTLMQERRRRNSLSQIAEQAEMAKTLAMISLKDARAQSVGAAAGAGAGGRRSTSPQGAGAAYVASTSTPRRAESNPSAHSPTPTSKKQTIVVAPKATTTTEG